MVSIQGSLLIECTISRISGRGEIQSKLSTSSAISIPVDRISVCNFNCLTLYDGDGKDSLKFLGITISFTKKKIQLQIYNICE